MHHENRPEKQVRSTSPNYQKKNVTKPPRPAGRDVTNRLGRRNASLCLSRAVPSYPASEESVKYRFQFCCSASSLPSLPWAARGGASGHYPFHQHSRRPLVLHLAFPKKREQIQKKGAEPEGRESTDAEGARTKKPAHHQSLFMLPRIDPVQLVMGKSGGIQRWRRGCPQR